MRKSVLNFIENMSLEFLFDLDEMLLDNDLEDVATYLSFKPEQVILLHKKCLTQERLLAVNHFIANEKKYPFLQENIELFFVYFERIIELLITLEMCSRQGMTLAQMQQLFGIDRRTISHMVEAPNPDRIKPNYNTKHLDDDLNLIFGGIDIENTCQLQIAKQLYQLSFKHQTTMYLIMQAADECGYTFKTTGAKNKWISYF